MALLALFVALGGGALAATRFIGSDGQIHACVAKRGQLTVAKRGNSCGEGKSALAWSERGPRGIRGIRGAQGVPGRGAMSFEREFDFDPSLGASKNYDTVVNGFRIEAFCSTTSTVGNSPVAAVLLQRIDDNHRFYAWGTKAEDGSLTRASTGSGTGTFEGTTFAQAKSTAELDVVAESTAAGKAIKWTRFDLTVIRGSKCHLHGLITPPSAVG